jgi:hypothetical protein
MKSEWLWRCVGSDIEGLETFTSYNYMSVSPSSVRLLTSPALPQHSTAKLINCLLSQFIRPLHPPRHPHLPNVSQSPKSKPTLIHHIQAHPPAPPTPPFYPRNSTKPSSSSNRSASPSCYHAPNAPYPNPLAPSARTHPSHRI